MLQQDDSVDLVTLGRRREMKLQIHVACYRSSISCLGDDIRGLVKYQSLAEPLAYTSIRGKSSNVFAETNEVSSWMKIQLINSTC